MRVSFLEAQHKKWRRALAGNKILPIAGSTASRQLLAGYLRLGNAAEAAAPAGHAAMWKQVQAHGLAHICLHTCRAFLLEAARVHASIQCRLLIRGERG